MQKENYQERIVIDPAVMVGKPVIKGTRITVELVLRLIAQGMAVDEIVTQYPHLTKDDVYAAVAYAEKVVKEEVVFPLTASRYGNAQVPA
jgi:uncharacterized protein (DUF433 family)